MKSNRTNDFESAGRSIRRRNSPRSLKRLILSTYESWSDDNGPRLAAALAYYALFSLAPLLMIAMAIFGSFFGQRPLKTALIAQFYGLVGPMGSRAIEAILEDLHRPGITTLAGGTGTVFLAIGASSFFAELQEALNTIWHVREMSGAFWQLVIERLLSFFLVMVTAALLILSVLLTTAEAGLGRTLAIWWPRFEFSPRLTAIFGSLAITILLFGLILKLLPKAPITWRDVAPAAVVTAVMYDAGKLLIALYLGKSSVVSAYGAASSLVVVVGWAYYSSLILYFGAEFAKEYTQSYGSLAKQHPS